jgi:hypothetical protein
MHLTLSTVTGIVSWLTLRFNFLFANFGAMLNFRAMEFQAGSVCTELGSKPAEQATDVEPHLEPMWQDVNAVMQWCVV